MIWHIVRKDLRLLWPMAVIVAAVNLANAVLLIVGGTFARTSQLIDPGTLSWVSNLALPAVGMIGLVLLVVGAIQQDPLPGTTQDWLTRPIPRRQLWAAKLTFVVLVGLSPILLGDVAMGFAAHFLPAEVIAASLTRSLTLLCLVCAPAAMIAAVTRKLTDVLVFGIGLIILAVAVLIALFLLGIQAPVMQTGYEWVVLWILVGLGGGLAVLLVPLQFHWRSTHRVRVILLIVGGLLPLLLFIPWNAAIQLQQLLGGHESSALTVNEDDSRPATFQEIGAPVIGGSQSKVIWLSIPVTVGGNDANERVYLDRTAFRVVDMAGLEIYRGNSWGNRMPIPVGFFIVQEAGNPRNPPAITLPVPAEIFAAARSAHAQVVVDIDLTEFARSAEKPLGSITHDFPDEHTRCGERQMYGSSIKGIYCESTREIGDCSEIKEPVVGASPAIRRSFPCVHPSYAPRPLPIWRDPYYSVYYWGLVAWNNSDFPRMRPEQTAPLSSLWLDSYSPTTHLKRSISFPIDKAITKLAAQAVHTIDGIGGAARFASPGGAVVDQRGNLFVVDKAESVIRRVTPSGEVSTFAGTPRQSGRDDGTGQDARFKHPLGIGIDGRDNLYVADTGNGLIRKITPTGIVSTVMTAAPIKSPVAVIPAGDGALYVIDDDETAANASAAVVKKIAPNGVVSTVAGPGADRMQPSP